jgi:hypothetical protein
MLTIDQFESGFRLNEYIAHLAINKENFRANFIRAVECVTPEDLSFFRSLPHQVRVAVLTDDASPDALRDVPIISRLAGEVTRLSLRLFSAPMHGDAAISLRQIAQDTCPGNQAGLPVIAFFDENMACIGVQCGTLPALADEMQERRRAWAAEHPDVKDALAPLNQMSALTRTKLTQVMYAMTNDQRVAWGRQLVGRWRQILATN